MEFVPLSTAKVTEIPYSWNAPHLFVSKVKKSFWGVLKEVSALESISGFLKVSDYPQTN